MAIVVGPGVVVGPGIEIAGPVIPQGSVAVDNVVNDQWLTIADNAALDMASSDFTIECWLYATVIGGATETIFSKKALQFSGYSGVQLSYNGGGNDKPVLRASTNGTSWNVQFTSTLHALANQWNHLAVTRSGNTWTIWINGLSGGSVSVSGTVYNTSAPFTIASGQALGGFGVPGYISNFRVVKGVAVYTGAFTPATAPLTATQAANVNGSPSAAITGTQTSLLLNTNAGAGFLTDSSTYNFTVTNNGGALSSTATPF